MRHGKFNRIEGEEVNKLMAFMWTLLNTWLENILIVIQRKII
jgi:hypothetical protein